MRAVRSFVVIILVGIAGIGAMSAQEMVISEYFNIQDVNSEWTELVVVADNLNAVGWILTDANTNQIVRQGGPQFLDVALWRNLRAGTIIVLWHRNVPVGYVTDDDPADGYLELSARDSRYFTTYYFAAPDDRADLNIADQGDVLQIIRADQSHVHALGHNKPTGAAYNTIPSPKANFDSGTVGASRSNRVTGRTLAAYGVGLTKDSVVGGFNDSRGLPNRWDLARINQGLANINHWFWRETREPKWSSVPSVSLIAQSASSNTIEWTAVDDPNPTDSTTGYMIIRDSLGFSGFPANAIRDGSIITKGTKIGSATVLDVRPTKLGRRLVDSMNILCGMTYTYRVYGYRYRRDDLLATTDDTTARGRQYTDRRWAESGPITKSNPTKPTIRASRLQICPGDTVTLTTTMTDAVLYEWTVNGQPVPVGGTTRIVVRAAGDYRLVVKGADGCSAISDAVTITALPAPSVEIRPSTAQIICAGDSVTLTAVTVATSYEWLKDGQIIPGATSSSFVAKAEGDYQVRIASAAGCPGISPSVRIRHTNVKFSVEPQVVNFGVIGQCKTDTTVVVEIVNQGQASVTITNANFPPGFALVSPAPGFQVPAGGRQRVTLVFAPSAPGLFSSTATFLAQPCGATASFSVRGQRTAVSVSLNKPGVDFGTFTACPTGGIRPDSTFCVRNAGTEPIVIGVPRVDPPFYLLTDIPRPVSIAPGAEFCISVMYRPLGADLDRGVIQTIAFPYTSASCQDTLRARVQAASYRPAAVVDEPSIDLGVVFLCSPQVDTVVQVTNTSLVPITVVNVLGKDLQFLGSPITIDPKASRTIPVRIIPSGGAGAFSISARVVIDPCQDTLDVQLVGVLLDVVYGVDQAEIDFGDLVLCRDSSRSAELTLSAGGLAGLRSRLRQVRLVTPFSSSVVAGTSFRDSLRISLRFTPSGQGVFIDTLLLQIDPCGTEQRIVLRGRAVLPRRTTIITSPDFGLLGSGSSAVRTITITNTGQTSIVVPAIVGVNAPFKVVASRPSLPATLIPGAVAEIDIEYAFVGYDRRDTISILSLTEGDCPDTVRFVLLGTTTGKGTVAGLRVVAPKNVTAFAGTDVELPLDLTSTVALDSANIRSMRVDLTYDHRLMRPDALSTSVPGLSATFREDVPGKATIEITSDRPILPSVPLVKIRARTYVGPVRTTILDVDTAVAAGAVITGDDGSLTVVGDCEIEAASAGVIRPIVFRAYLGIDEQLHVEYSTVTTADVVISVTAVDGTTREWQWPSSNDVGLPRHVVLPIDELGAGTFIISYVHGRHVRHIPVVIIR